MRQLERASRGLVFISETDATVSPIVAGVPRSRSLRSYLTALKIKEKPVKEVAVNDFFDRLTAKKDWHGPQEKKLRRGFEKLRAELEQALEDIRVIRVGKTRIDIYIVGVDQEGRLAGVRTEAIET